MTLLYARLNDRITRGAQTTVKMPGRTKSYNTAGKLFQNFLADRPVHCYDVSHGLRSRDDFQLVVDAFYIVMVNGYEGFLHKDWRDYLASQSNTRCNIIDSNTLQLQRKHFFGGVTWYRDITKPCALPIPVIYRTRAGVVSIASATISTTTGIASTLIGHSSGDTYTWAGQFDVPVTFTEDKWVGTLEASTENLHVQSQAIELEELPFV